MKLINDLVVSKSKPKKVCTLYTKDGSIVLFHILRGFGFEPIYLDAPAISDLDRISRFLSQEWCFPLKILFTDLYKGLSDGADIAIGVSYGFFKYLGPCKLNYVMESKAESLLRKCVKKDFKYVVFNFPPPITFVSILKLLSDLDVNIKNPLVLYKARKLYSEGIDRGYELYELENAFRRVRARASDKEEVIDIYRRGVKKFREAYKKDEWSKVSTSIKNKFAKVKKKRLKKFPRIGITGDYYSIIANFPSFDIENFLSTKFDVEIVQDHALSKVFREFNPIKPIKHIKTIEQYTKYWMGGSDTMTLNSLFQYNELKVDGIVHLKAFTCMPEDMVSLIIEEIEKNEKDFPPILSLGFDEHSSVEGLKTRLEAFCNTILLRQRAVSKKVFS